MWLAPKIRCYGERNTPAVELWVTTNTCTCIPGGEIRGDSTGSVSLTHLTNSPTQSYVSCAAQQFHKCSLQFVKLLQNGTISSPSWCKTGKRTTTPSPAGFIFEKQQKAIGLDIRCNFIYIWFWIFSTWDKYSTVKYIHYYCCSFCIFCHFVLIKCYQREKRKAKIVQYKWPRHKIAGKLTSTGVLFNDKIV